MARRIPPPQLIGSGLIPETFQSEYAGYENDYQSKLAGLGRDERSLFADYGFQGGVGVDGSVNFQADPTTQHGLYQNLLRNIGGQLGQAKQEVRGRGLGRAGLAKARENLIRFMMSGEKSSLLNAFNKNATNLFGQRGAALTDRNRNFNMLEGKALDWWNQYGPDDPDGNVAEPTDEVELPSFAPAMTPVPGTPSYPNSLLGVQASMIGSSPGATLADVIPGYQAPQQGPAFADPYAAQTPSRRRSGQATRTVVM